MRARSLGRNTPSGSLLKRKIQVHIESLGLKAGKWPQKEGPVVELLPNQGRFQAVGGGLQRCRIVHRQESAVVFAESDAGALEFPLDEAVAIEPVGGAEGKETGHAHDDRPRHLAADLELEVIVGEAAAQVRQDAVVEVLGGNLPYGDAEGTAVPSS
jgi:hypothetical protein